MEFEWDDEKNRDNIRKHGLDFTDGEELFTGPLPFLVAADQQEHTNEERWSEKRMKKLSKTNWHRIDALKDDDIDYSDDASLTPAFFEKAVRWPGNKELISLRLDPDVLAFFKSQGKGYQTTINLLLRKYMEAQHQVLARRGVSSVHHQSTLARTQARKKK